MLIVYWFSCSRHRGCGLRIHVVCCLIALPPTYISTALHYDEDPSNFNWQTRSSIRCSGRYWSVDTRPLVLHLYEELQARPGTHTHMQQSADTASAQFTFVTEERLKVANSIKCTKRYNCASIVNNNTEIHTHNCKWHYSVNNADMLREDMS